MEIKLDQRVFEGTGVKERSSFKIKPDALMFRKLSKDIYQNPLQAVFRELLSNAVDACNLDPSKVSVTLPSIQNSSLIISDTGRGMPHDFVMDRYTTYGESTKSADNNSIGGFGFGGKTPFSLTNSFSLQVFSPTELRTYSCFINEQSFPDIALVFQGPNVHKNRKQGVDVTVPIKSSDYASLESYAKVLQFTMYLEYGKTFLINGQQYDEALFKKVQFLRNKNAVIVTEYETANFFVNTHFVLMGGIPYSLSDFKPPYTTSNVFSNIGTVFYFGKIGEFGVTLSREHLEKNDAVKAEIHKRHEDYYCYCVNEAKLWFESTFSKRSERDKLLTFHNFQENPYYSFLPNELKIQADSYQTVSNYYKFVYFEKDRKDSRGRWTLSYEKYPKEFLVYDPQPIASASKVITSSTFLRKKTGYEPLDKKVSPDKFVNIVNDTVFLQDALLLRLHRLTKHKLAIPASLVNKKYFVFVSDKIKTIADMEAALPAIDAYSATKFIEEMIPDKKAREKFVKDIKPSERIRFKKMHECGLVEAITIEDVENIVGPVYYSTLDGKNTISCTGKSHKDRVANKNLLLNYGLTDIYLVPENKEKLLDTSIFIKLDTIISDGKSTVFETRMREVAKHAYLDSYDVVESIRRISDNYNKLNIIRKLATFTNRDLWGFQLEVKTFLEEFKKASNQQPINVLYFESSIFKEETKKWKDLLDKLSSLLDLLLNKYTLIVKDNSFYLYDVSKGVPTNLPKQLKYYLDNIEKM